MLLIDAEGTKRGVVPTADALREAEELGLDLVEVAGGENPPVCKIMDYGKMAYQAKKKKTHVKSATELKEISFSMKISGHDIETKLKQARQFVEKGHKLRFNLILRGRERAYADTQGMSQLRRLIELMKDVASVEQMSEHMMGNRLFCILAPVKVKAVTKKEAAAEKAAAAGAADGKPAAAPSPPPAAKAPVAPPADNPPPADSSSPQQA